MLLSKNRIWSRLKNIPLKIWLWIHKALILLYTFLMFIGLPEADNIFLDSENAPHIYSDYIMDPIELCEAYNILLSNIFHAIFRVMIFLLICFSWVMSIRAFKYELTDDDLKRDYFKDWKNILDILLNIITVIFFIKTNGTVNYTFLRTDSSECDIISEISLCHRIDKDVSGDNCRTSEITVRIGDISLDTDTVKYKLSDISPLAWSIPLPFGKEYTVWWDKYDAGGSGYFFDGFNAYFGDEKYNEYTLYSIGCGNISLPLDKDNYRYISDILSGYENEDINVTITYFEHSHIIRELSFERGIRI